MIIIKVYGPYTRNDGRQHVVLYDGNSKTTMSYPKYLVLQQGFKMDEDDTIDHIDGDFNNNDFKNLRIVNRKQHSLEDSVKLVSQEFTCPMCGKVFILEDKKLSNALRNRRRKNKEIAGPFCSRSCAGLYGSYVQNGYMDKLEQIKMKGQFYKYKDVLHIKSNLIS